MKTSKIRMKFNVINSEQAKQLKTLCKPIVPLVGYVNNDPNRIIKHFAEAAEKAGWVKENIDLVIDEMRSTDYNHLLVIAIGFTRESENDDKYDDDDDDDDYPDD